jgi:hypothetical protein
MLLDAINVSVIMCPQLYAHEPRGLCYTLSDEDKLCGITRLCDANTAVHASVGHEEGVQGC